MTTKIEKFIIQIDDVAREMTEQEIAQLEADRAELAAQQAAAEAKAEARQSALAKLAELGLTEAEIAAL